MTKDSSGKVTVEKKGMEDQIRDGFDYEMTIAFNINNAKHMTEVGKDRTRLFTDQPEFVITAETGKMIRKWCDEGAEPAPPPKQTLTPAGFNKAVARIQAGELDLIDKVTTTYQLTDEQTTEINNLRP